MASMLPTRPSETPSQLLFNRPNDNQSRGDGQNRCHKCRRWLNLGGFIDYNTEKGLQVQRAWSASEGECMEVCELCAERYGAVGRKRPRKEAKDDGPASGVKRRKTVKQPAGNVNSAPGVLSNRPGVLGTVGTSTLSAGILNAGAPVTGFGASTLQTAPPSSGWEYVGINRPGIFPTGGWQPSYTYPIAPSASGLTASAPPPWAPAGGPATGYVGTGTFNGGSASASTYNGSQVAGHPFNNGFIDTSILDTPWAVYAPMNCYIVPGFDMDKGGQRNTRN